MAAGIVAGRRDRHVVHERIPHEHFSAHSGLLRGPLKKVPCGQGPCYGRNNSGISNDRLYTEEAIRLIEANDPTVPFFMCEPTPPNIPLDPATFPTFQS